jgi:hypothetical protein
MTMDERQRAYDELDDLLIERIEVLIGNGNTPSPLGNFSDRIPELVAYLKAHPRLIDYAIDSVNRDMLQELTPEVLAKARALVMALACIESQEAKHE